VVLSFDAYEVLRTNYRDLEDLHRLNVPVKMFDDAKEEGDCKNAQEMGVDALM